MKQEHEGVSDGEKGQAKRRGSFFWLARKGLTRLRSTSNAEGKGDTQMVDPFSKYGLEKGQRELRGLVYAD